MRTRIVVMAKAPAPGRSKTRLSPPLTPWEAAAVARACLEDTLEAVSASGLPDPVLALEGEPGPWLLPGFDVLPQRGRGLAERIANAFDDLAGPALLIGMDTPQVSPQLLRAGACALEAEGSDAVFGPALDGGWWALGLRRPDRRALLGVPMSGAFTGAMQRCRLADLGLRYRSLPVLRDVDRIEDAVAVASDAPASRFAAALDRTMAGAGLARVG